MVGVQEVLNSLLQLYSCQFFNIRGSISGIDDSLGDYTIVYCFLQKQPCSSSQQWSPTLHTYRHILKLNFASGPAFCAVPLLQELWPYYSLGPVTLLFLNINPFCRQLLLTERCKRLHLNLPPVVPFPWNLSFSPCGPSTLDFKYPHTFVR